jgi:pimeloyl-ACP methyl ester carboxylesterase
MARFLLLHGGGGGAWIWKHTAAALRQRGHDVYAVTFTGSGERRHLLSAGSNIQTHVIDVINELEFNDLERVVLVAHSYSGAVAPGVAAAAGSRLCGIVYLDALILRQGESAAQAMGFMSTEQADGVHTQLLSGASPLAAPTAEQLRGEAARKPFQMSAQRQEWLLSHLTDMPLAAMVTPAAVGAESIRLPVRYVAASDTLMKPKFHERAHSLGWPVRDIEGDHLFAIGDAERTAQILGELSGEIA